MQKLYLLAQQLGHSPRTLRAAVIDESNGIAHMVGKSSNNRDTLYVLDVDALKRWIDANISTQAHKPEAPTYKVAGARVWLRCSDPKLYGTIHDSRGKGWERELLITWDNAVTPEWMPHYETRLVK